MTNPTPRPALRKAEDATVHPAAPRPARSPRATKAAAPVVEPVTQVVAPAVVAEPPPAAVPAPTPAAAAVKPTKKKRKFGGATSDHLRVEDSADARPAAAPAKPAKKKGPSKQRAQDSTRDDLMQGKPTALDVEVPKALRKAAAKRAKAEGLDLQTVVIDSLHAYVTAPER